jgi:uncharacterized protein YigE (DUF2233 family)
MNTSLLLASALLVVRPAEPAEPVVPGEVVEPVLVRQIEQGGSQYTVVRLDLRQVELGLYGQDPAYPELQTFSGLESWLAERGRSLVVATNAGMFEADRSPVGLHIERGVQRHPIKLGQGSGNFFLLPNGVFYVDAQGAHVVESSAYSVAYEHVVLATQSGPLLVQAGEIHPAFNAGSPNRLLRSGVGVAEPWVVYFAISFEGVRFHDLATLFRDQLACQDALYLDGVVSTLKAPGIPDQVPGRYSGVLGVSVPAE